MKNTIVNILFWFVAATGLGQNPIVTNTAPVAQSLSAMPSDPIVVTFNSAINPSTITTSSFLVFGRWSGPMQGTLSVDNNTVTFTPIRPFFYGEMISVRLTSDIENTNSETLLNGFGFQYWIKTVPAQTQLGFYDEISMKLSGETFIQCYGAYAGDVNNDEFSDLVVITETAEDIRVLLNDGLGNYDAFTIFDMPNASRPSTNEGSDFDHDGLIDLAVGSIQNNNISVFMGNESTIFDAEIGLPASTGVRGIATVDINGDGWDDIVSANRSAGNISIITNDGTGSFNPATSMDAGVSGETAVVATDLNGDGFTDLIIGGYTSESVSTLLNDGSGMFSVSDVISVNGAPWMMAGGDFNGDGHADVATANSSSNDVSILLGDGLGNLALSANYAVGNFPLAIDVGDIDGDGDLDFISSNLGGIDFTQWENDGNGIFTNPISYPSDEAGSCAIMHDRDNDGAMDLSLIDEFADKVILYVNNPQLGINEIELLTVVVTPNPFQEEITINGAQHLRLTFNLYDIHGRLLNSGPVDDSINFGSVSLNTGIYILQLQSESATKNFKIIKQD